MSIALLKVCTREYLQSLKEELSSKLAEVEEALKELNDCSNAGHDWGVWHEDRSGVFKVCKRCGTKYYVSNR